MNAPLPRRPWRVKPWVYRVQPGDDLVSIARGLTQSECPCRVEQLLGANLHKDFGGSLGAPLDTCRVPVELVTGEALFVPLDWPEAPGYMGARVERFVIPDRMTVDPTGPYVAALTKYWGDVIAPVVGVAMPPGVSQTDVVSVVAAWFPYLRNSFPPQVPPLPNIVPGSWPMPQVAPPDPQQATWFANLLRAFQQAISLLANTDCTADIAKMIPWDRIPWNQVPWKEINAWAARMGWTPGQLWSFLGSALASVPGGISYRPMQAAAPAPTNLLEADFSSGPWSEISFADVLWQSQNWALLGDKEFGQCLRENPAQANRIAQCKDCFLKAGSDKFKEYICNPLLDPCDCQDDGDGKDDGKEIVVNVNSDDSKSNLPRLLFVGAGILSLAAAAISYGGAAREKKSK
jgi:hypothetical protein